MEYAPGAVLGRESGGRLQEQDPSLVERILLSKKLLMLIGKHKRRP